MPVVRKKQQRQARFWRKLLRLTRGRVTLLRAFQVILTEEGASPFARVVRRVHDDVQSGRALSEALSGCGREFSPSVIELIRAAERSGKWDEIFQEIADGLDEGTFD